MDLQALLVFVGGFAVCAGFVFLVSIFGAKEQTFEEALAAQKKKNEKEKTKGKKEKKDQTDKKSKPWRKKGKGEREEKVVVLDDDEEQVVVVPSPVVEEPLPVEEPSAEESPAPTPEPTPEPVKTKKERKKEEKKKRMPIQEVQEIIEEQVEVEPVAEEPVVEEASPPVLEDKVEVIEPVVEEEMVEEVVAAPVVQAAPQSKPSPVKQAKNKKKGDSNGSNPKDLLTVIKKTAFSDSEAQLLIDVLLTKQSGPGENLNNSEEWIEKGKPTESQKLKQQLGELEKLLGEEQMKGKSFQDKMAALRVELNQEKAAKASHSRIVEELNTRHGQEVNMVNNKMQGFVSENNLLKGQLSQVQLQMRDTDAMRAQYQATIDNLSGQLQMANSVAATASANDPHILSELEQLRSLRDKYEVTLAELSTNNTNLTSQLSSKMEEVTEIKSQVSLQNEELMGLRNQINAEQSRANTVQTALNTKTDEGKTLTAELARVNNLNESLKQIQKSETQKTVADPAVEAELATVKAKLGEKETENARLREDNERLAEQLASSVERPAAEGEEAGAENHNGVVGEEESEENSKASANAQLAEEWREKFDVLTSEHNKMLAKQKVLEADFDAKEDGIKSELESLKTKNNELSESLVKNKALMLRLFPSLSSDMDSGAMETKAQEYIQGLTSSQVEDRSDELEKLEGQVAHYKSVLNQTETMLNALQASVEAAEGEWRSKLESAQGELTSLRSENSNLLSRVHASRDAEEMQGKLEELQAKLVSESQEKGELEKKNLNLTENLEKEKEEKSELSKSVGALQARESELAATNTKLQQVLATTNEALSKESDFNKSLQSDQVSSKDVSGSEQNTQANNV